MDAALWTWSVELASGTAGLRAVWTWAFLEAIVLPLPPEILLIPLVVGRPDRAPMLALSAVVGSLLGGMVSYGLGRWCGNQAVAVLKRLPGVSPESVLWTSAMLKRFGMKFIAVSPWLVLPYKITSVLSGRLRISWWRYLLAGGVGRGTRLLGLTLAVAASTEVMGGYGPPHYLIMVMMTYAIIGGIVWAIRRWLLSEWMS